MQPYVLGLVDDAHAPATKLFKDAVVRDGLANHGYALRLWAGILLVRNRASQRARILERPEILRERNASLRWAHQKVAVSWCRGPESNWLRPPFQGGALPVSYPGTLESVNFMGARKLCQIARTSADFWCCCDPRKQNESPQGRSQTHRFRESTSRGSSEHCGRARRVQINRAHHRPFHANDRGISGHTRSARR